MAESIISLTEGSGAKKTHTFQRTIGGNSVEDQVVLHGENYLASYTVTSGDFLTTTAASHLLQIMAGASLNVRIRRIEVYQVAMATAAALMQTFVLRLSSAGTGGTALTPNPLDAGDAASGATAMALPSSKGTEGAIIWTGEAYMMQTVGASAQLNQPIITIDFDRPRSKPLIIAAGITNGIAIKNITGVSPATVRYTVWFDETAF